MKLQVKNLVKNLGMCGKAAKTYMVVNSPSLMTGAGITGVVATSIAASIATVRTVDTLREMPSSTPSEKLTATWMNYIPTALIGGVTIACIFGSNRENNKRVAALASAYSLSEERFKEYSDKVKEAIGPNKARDIDVAAAQNAYSSNSQVAQTVETGHGDTIFFDEWSGRKFKSDRMFLESVILSANKDLQDYRDNNGLYFVTINDIYTMWGLPEGKGAEEMGWNSFGDMVKAYFTPVYDDDGVTVVHHISFDNVEPTFEDPRR